MKRERIEGEWRDYGRWREREWRRSVIIPDVNVIPPSPPPSIFLPPVESSKKCGVTRDRRLQKVDHSQHTLSRTTRSTVGAWDYRLVAFDWTNIWSASHFNLWWTDMGMVSPPPLLLPPPFISPPLSSLSTPFISWQIKEMDWLRLGINWRVWSLNRERDFIHSKGIKEWISDWLQLPQVNQMGMTQSERLCNCRFNHQSITEYRNHIIITNYYNCRSDRSSFSVSRSHVTFLSSSHGFEHQEVSRYGTITVYYPFRRTNNQLSIDIGRLQYLRRLWTRNQCSRCCSSEGALLRYGIRESQSYSIHQLSIPLSVAASYAYIPSSVVNPSSSSSWRWFSSSSPFLPSPFNSRHLHLSSPYWIKGRFRTTPQCSIQLLRGGLRKGMSDLWSLVMVVWSLISFSPSPLLVLSAGTFKMSIQMRPYSNVRSAQEPTQGIK